MKRHVLLSNDEIALLNAISTRPGLSAISQIIERATNPNTGKEATYIQRAREEYEQEGMIEFDDMPLVSDSEEGAYVMAWVWVPNED